MSLFCIPIDNALKHKTGNLYYLTHNYSSTDIRLLCEKNDIQLDWRIQDDVELATKGSVNALIRLSGSKRTSSLLELAVQQCYKWSIGSEIKVLFLNSDPNGTYSNSQIIDWANEWSHYANISFVEVDTVRNSDLRFEYSTDGACWSWLGTNAKSVDVNLATIHLTFFNDILIDKANVLHEFGHALGCIHEHQSPVAGILWNIPFVYNEFYRLAGWDRLKVYNNVIRKYAQAEITNSIYDDQSIMIYPILDWMTTNGYTKSQNYQLSDLDKTFIANIYP